MEVDALKRVHPCQPFCVPYNKHRSVTKVVLSDISLASRPLLCLALVVEAFGSILFVVLGNQLIVALIYM